MVQSKLEDTKSKKDMLHRAHADTLKNHSLLKHQWWPWRLRRLNALLLDERSSAFTLPCPGHGFELVLRYIIQHH
jgi:hypothetical protein